MAFEEKLALDCEMELKEGMLRSDGSREMQHAEVEVSELNLPLIFFLHEWGFGSDVCGLLDLF